MVVDYQIIRRGNFCIPSFYTVAEGKPYFYYHGWNLRPVVAWVAGVAFTVHGIAGSLDPESVNSASKDMYKLGFLLSFYYYGVRSLLCSLSRLASNGLSRFCDKRGARGRAPLPHEL